MEQGLTKVEKYQALQRLELCIEMLDSPMVRNSDIFEIDKHVLPALVKAQEDLGFDPKDEKFSHLLTTISDEIKISVPNIRLAEIPIAIHKGVLGDYGEYFGLSVVTVIKFMKSHYTSLKRAEIAKSIPQEEEEKPIPTKEEQKEVAKKHIVDAFEKYKEDKKTGYAWVYLYRWLNDEFQAITFTNEVKWKIYYKAILVTIANKDTGTLGDYISSVNRKDVKIIRDLMGKEKDEIKCAKLVAKHTPNKTLLTQIRNESERLAVAKLFDDLLEMETEITDLLTD